MRDFLLLAAVALACVATVLAAGPDARPTGSVGAEPETQVSKKPQRYSTETKREREEMLRDKKRIVQLIREDQEERKIRFVYVEPEATLAPPADEDPASRRDRQKLERERERRQRYSTETKREREHMLRDRERIRVLILADKGERKHKFPQVEPAEPRAEEDQEATSQRPPSECKLTLRFPDGSVHVRDHSPREQLAAVRLYVRSENPSVPFSKIAIGVAGGEKFSSASLKQSLASMGLCPASELEVKFES